MSNTSFLKVTNNAVGHLAAAISNTDLAFSLQAGEGALFPSTGPFTVSTNSEIILCDSRSGDNFVVNASGRGYDGTTAESHLTSATIELRWISKNNDIIIGAITSVENMTFGGVTFAQGGIPYRASSGDGALTPLAKGTANQVLKMAADASLPQWREEYGAASIVVGEVPTGSVNGSNQAYTLASTQATGSLEVFKNGVRMKAGGADYTESSGGFTMVTAPATGTVLLCNYYKTVDFAVVGTNSLIEDETPTGTVNGSNTAFTVIKGSYIAGSLAVYLNGQKLTHTADFTESTPASGTFAFVTAPATGAVVRVGYQFVTNTAGNADTVDGVHASSTPTASTILPLNASAQFPESVLGNGTRPRVVARQGGSATDWNATGTTTYTPTTPIIQCGSGITSGGQQTSGSFYYSSLSVTFPIAYADKPIVVANVTDGNGYCKVNVINTGFTITNWSPYTGGVDGNKINWIAIGI